MSDRKEYDVRVVECYGRRRALVEIKCVTKEEGLVQAGAALVAGRHAGEGGTWVQPRIVIRRRFGENARWVDQPFDVNRKAVRAFMSWMERAKKMRAA